MINRRSTPKLRLTALALISGLALAACSPGGSGVQLQSIDSSTPTATSAPTAPATSASVTPTLPSLPPSGSVNANNSSSTPTGSIATPSSRSSQPTAVSASPSTNASTGGTTSGTTSSTSDSSQPNLTSAQQAAARLAVAAFNGYVKVSTAAEKEPGKNWAADIRKYAADPTAATTLDQIASLKTAKVHATSVATYSNITVTAATAQKVVIRACVDGSGTKIADASGKPFPLKLSAHPRVLLTYNVYLYDAKYGGWLVSETVAPNPVKPC